MEASATGQPAQYLTFRVSDGEYAINILRVREIIQVETLTRVPTTPAWIRGVINLRGSVVPVVDLAAKFGLPETAITPLTCIVIIEVQADGERTVMGVMADGVNQVVDLGADDLAAPPAFGTRVRVEYLAGMAKVGQGLALVLDIDRVLSTDELAATVAAVEVTDGDAAARKDAPPSRRRRPPKAATPAHEGEPPSRSGA